MKKAKGGKSVAKPYDPTSREKAALSSWEERKEKRSPLPLFKSEMLPDRNGIPSVKISIDHEDGGAAGCTVRAAARGKESQTATTSTATEQSRPRLR
ncbi:MAG TPA: hypothetical protein VGX71_19115 [Pseudaminobacter sp.]|nr:hypothetical protein [Pseudaminobacter sp.]